ncbi:MAG: prolyl oligopeptidase family serine peptidase [Terriglobia bacterium]
MVTPSPTNFSEQKGSPPARIPIRKAWIILLLGIGLLAMTSNEPLPPIPPTPKKPIIDVYHGVKVEDDYQWLENWDDPAVRSWSDAENARARAFLDALPARQEIFNRLKSLYDKTSASYSRLEYRPGILFAMKSQPPKQQPFLITLNAQADPQSERVVVDPNQMDPSGGAAIDFYVPSLDGRRVAVSLSQGGSESGSVHVYDVQTGKPVADVIPRVNGGTAGGSVAWNADGTGFYYTRYPRSGERPAADLDFYQQVYFHKLGAPVSSDTYSLGEDFPRIAEIHLQTSPDGRYVLAAVANGDGGEFEHCLLGPNGKWTQLTQFTDGVTRAVFGKDQALYLVSQNGAPRGKILRMPLGHPVLADAKTIVPQGEDAIQYCVPTAHHLYVVDVWGGPSDVRVFDFEGHERGNIPLEPVSSVRDLVALGGDEVLFQNESFVSPPAWIRYDPSLRKVTRTELYVKPAADYSDTEVVRAFATSKDGAKVPMSIIRRKGIRLDRHNPTLLTGYGGFDISLSPVYSLNTHVWLDQGGVWVVANLRGGGEYGEDWHKAGALTHKQNVFDDFAACAEYLTKAGYTSPSQFAIMGGSNGGLLMGAEITQHPELFHAVVSFVGIYDMLRHELSPNAVFNVTEYGTIKDAADFKALFAYSPYHHVVDGTAYPAVLMMTGANDPRVNPMQSRKMTARLQSASSSGLPILLRTSSNAGHGVGSSMNQRIEQATDMFAFLFHELGVSVKPFP